MAETPNPPILSVKMKVGDPRPVLTPELWSSFLVNELKGFQCERNEKERDWIDALRYAMAPQKPLTRWQRIKDWVSWHFSNLRRGLARWIAGPEWPEEW